ncbi:exodeoxyribonuclease VII large subunit [Boudabousia marimammalium]|uniref:Exodeoxyribonuclease 7 large subunit n=1 Tax=Boudabousia marimammalium TaxID=156892 RepID=A0A1Q5PS72_9ACTO|nr:exodeoxyribonuclease VII large subunit [Boudabousia marimammalium]OKL50260.1 exodeoxyribonuclease VII large subunit [Boudabousia marimammalium]
MDSTLPRLAGETTRENPWPLRLLTEKMKAYIERMSTCWVEGEVVELKIRPGNRMSFLTLRDIEAETQMNVALWASAIQPVKETLEPGARVVVQAKPTFWERSGSLQLQGTAVHLQGLGDMLARIEMLRQQLQAEGLFAAELKKPLPFIPRKIGLICGQGAKAEQDVKVNARLRWPGAIFETRYANVQGEHTAATVINALTELDQIEDVDVIIITRGGGAVTDLLPFSDERIVRAVAAATTPIVSAIGHETDAPLLDLVADYRASTPTDAARKVVPDLAQELEGLNNTIQQGRSLILARLDDEQKHLNALYERPTFASPIGIIDSHSTEIERAQQGLQERISNRLDILESALTGYQRELKALSPQSILERGYTVLRTPDRKVVTDATSLKKGDLVEGMLAHGSFVASIVGTNTNQGSTK